MVDKHNLSKQNKYTIFTKTSTHLNKSVKSIKYDQPQHKSNAYIFPCTSRKVQQHDKMHMQLKSWSTNWRHSECSMTSPNEFSIMLPLNIQPVKIHQFKPTRSPRAAKNCETSYCRSSTPAANHNREGQRSSARPTANTQIG